jgi:DNA-binding transcriptional MerR regulator
MSSYSLKDMMDAGNATARLVRGWERQGLLGAVERTEGGHRRYTAEQVETARQIAAARKVTAKMLRKIRMSAEYDL